MPLPVCPSQQEWLAFHFGQLPAERLDSLRDHLECCPRCESSLEHFDPLTDPVISALRLPTNLSSGQLAGRAEDTRASVAGPLPAESDSTPPPDEPPSLQFLAPAQEPDELGRLADFRVLKVLGQGGMGIVFLAEDTRLRRRVALKVLKPNLAAEPNTRLRFLREARAGAALEGNDHIVVIHLVGEVNGLPYFAMELLEGETLESWRRRIGSPSPLQLMQVGREIAAGLAAAHDRGLIHRDIKPTNIWIEPRPGGGFRVKLLDFGLALGETGDTRLTRVGTLVGTPAFMAPEMAEGRRLDGRCDLFCLGSVLYYLATGSSPFAGDTTVAALWAVSFKQPAPLGRLQPGLPPALADLVMRLLAKDPDNRFPSARAVVDALRSIEIGEQPTVPISREVPDASPPSRWRWGLPGLGMVITLAAIAGWEITHPSGELPRPASPPSIAAVVPPPTAPAPPTEEEAWLKAVAVLAPQEQLNAVIARLKKRNPGYDGTLGPRVLVNETGVIELTFPSNRVTDLSPLRALKKLQYLNVGSSLPGERSPLADLSPLAGLSLTDLQCASTSVMNIAWLGGMPLERLALDKTLVHDLGPLRQMASLKMLSCGHTPIGDLSPLQDLPLELLSIEITRISDLGPLRKTPLKHIDCSGTLVDDLSPLAGKPIIYLKITNSRITNLEPLRTMKLDYLAANIDKGRDAKLLQSIETLRSINNIPVAEFWKQNP